MVRYPVGPWSMILSLALLLICHLAVEHRIWEKIYGRLTPLAWGLAHAAVVLFIFETGRSGQQTFIYFQF